MKMSRRRIFIREWLMCMAIHVHQYQQLKKWCAEFKRGRESLEDDPRSGRPNTATTQEIIEVVHDMIMGDRRVTIDMIAEEVGISHGSVWNIIHYELDMKKVCARWVPKMLRKDE
jgi:histone-lysine N-methyltransferase SETMAR